MDDAFERCVFNKMDKGFKKKKYTAFSSTSVKFDEAVTENLLNFDALLKQDKGASITQMQRGYKVKLTKPHLAFNMQGLLESSNPGIDLRFSEDLLDYEPDDELIVKSSVPLWVIKPTSGGNTVSIQRMW